MRTELVDAKAAPPSNRIMPDTGSIRRRGKTVALTMRAVLRAMLFGAALLHAHAVAARELPCGPDAPCKTANGSYHLSIPKGWDGKAALPAVIFFHGHNSSGRNAVRNTGLVRKIVGRGYLLIAPNGSAASGRKALGWPANRTAKGRRDDIAFTAEIINDVARRMPLDRSRVIVSGFSSGGSMVWHLACYTRQTFAAFVSVAGGLRRPIPQDVCPAGPQRLLHIHGFTDAQVPLEGRRIREWHQGDVFEGLSVLRRTNACRSNPSAFSAGTRYQCRRWTGCEKGADIRFCLHRRGHEMPRGWDTLMFAWLEDAGAAPVPVSASVGVDLGAE